VVERVEMERHSRRFRVTVRGRQALKTAEILDDRVERGHETVGTIAKLDRARQVRHSRFQGDLPRVKRERKRGRDSSVGFLSEGIAEDRMVLAYIE
jgi:hypothetical protein